MKRRVVIAFVWFWGIWSAGSALDFLGILPVWPFLLLGVGIAGLIVVPPTSWTSARQLSRAREPR
jgi:hypothetical protein